MAAALGLSHFARVLLGCIRLFNGLAALLAPAFLARQVGIDPKANPGALYVFRMFGIRTVIIGAELLLVTGERRRDALRQAVLIHASDTFAALLASRSEQFPRNGRVIVAISALNTVLAIVAHRGEQEGGQGL